MIRALQNLSEPHNYVYGPINCLTELFSTFDQIYRQDVSFGLFKDTSGIISFEEPISAPRVGLNKSKNQIMHDKLYRFLVLPKKKHADKGIIEKAMRLKDYPEDQIKKIWG